MRLLSRTTEGDYTLTTFADENLPRYAILSHTWERDQEVTYNELITGAGKKKIGYEKIRFCGERAAEDGIEYFWVDTCCINKAGNDELSFAINSMFRWYQRAAKCYVFLPDVVLPHDVPDLQAYHITWKEAFRRSRWFTRGWTLQELLAPPSVEFFCKEGKRLGDKISLENDIHQITQISMQALRGSPLAEFGVEERMRWAAKRKTTLGEDRAYCLLGIFGVFIPLIYGEGETHALMRLQEEVQKRLKQRGQTRLYGLTALTSSPLQTPEKESETGGTPTPPAVTSPSPGQTQTSPYGRFQSLASCKPVLSIPTKEIERNLKWLPRSRHLDIAGIITFNCKVAAFEFYNTNSLWVNGFHANDKPTDRKLFQLPDGRFPQKPDDLDLRTWIYKIQHYSTTYGGPIRDLYATDRYHMKGALGILKMTYPWGLLDPMELESSLCYAISWCSHLYAGESEARLRSLWVELHPPEIDDNWEPNPNFAKISELKANL